MIYTMPKYKKNGVRPDLDGLVESVAHRGGLFTTKEAEKYNISRRLLTHYSKSGKLVRIARGLYRPKAFPTHRHEDLITCMLAVGKGSVVAGPTALEVYLPGYLVVNKIYVRRGPGKKQLHIPAELKERVEILDYKKQDNTTWDGVPVEIVKDAFKTCTELKLLDADQISRIYNTAEDQGLISPILK